MYLQISEEAQPQNAVVDEVLAMRYDQRFSGLGTRSSLGSSFRPLISHHLAELPLGVTCEKETILDRFNVGEYRLLPYHYERLWDFMTYVRGRHEAGALAELYVVIEGHTDNTETKKNANAGLSFMRAVEVKTFVSEWLSQHGVPVPIKFGSWAATRPIPRASREKNRRVEVRLCRGLPT